MSWIKAPKTNKYFWLFHFSGWGVFILINFLTRQFNKIESLEQGLVSMAVLLTVNTALCLILRELIHRWRLFDSATRHVWVKITLLVVLLGLLSATLNTFGLGLYYLWFGYATQLIFFILTVLQNWLVLSLIIGIWAVVYVVTVHASKLNQIRSEKQQVQLQLKEAQLNALIGQLNPHFLFNGLNNIRGLMLEDVARARYMLTEMSELLRYSLQAPKQELVALEEELEVVRSYVELAKIQYEERLIYTEQIDPTSLSLMLPPLMIQLLVENAIKHGIDQHKTAGELNLRISIEDDLLVVEVTNPGYFDSDKSALRSGDSSGLGLVNIKQRLMLLFGEQAELKINNTQEKVTVTVTLPRITAMQQQVAL